MPKYLQTLLVATVASVAIAACGPRDVKHPPLRGYIVSSLTGTSQAVLTQAVSDIETASQDRFMTDQSSDYPVTVKFGKLTGYEIGLAQTDLEDGCTITLDLQMNPDSGSGWNTEDLRHVIIHELGHCYGLPHDPDPLQIMFWEYDRKQNTPAAFDYFIQKINQSRSVL